MSKKSGSGSNRPMSIDAMLDMERQEVLALLESKNQSSTSPERVRSNSPLLPRSPVRSMLDIPEEQSGSSAGPSRHSPPHQAPVRSMLDFDTPASNAKPRGSSTSPSSPLSPSSTSSKVTASRAAHPRSKSDASSRPVEFGPRIGAKKDDPTSGYQFSGFLPHSQSAQFSKRNSQSGKRSSGGSLGDVLGGNDFGIPFLRDRGRHSSVGPRLGNKSQSPHNRPPNRSRSPAPGNVFGSKVAVEGSEDFSNAYRRLSDANLAFSSGSLAHLPVRKASGEPGEGRLIKDYLGPDGEHLGSSEDEETPFSSDDEDRGRKKAPRSLNPDAKGSGSESKSRSRSNGREHRPTRSLLAAAEEERTSVASGSSRHQYRSMIEPEIRVTNTSGKTVKPAKNAIHPNTSYDQGPGDASPSAMDSDEEADVDDIVRAQKLSFEMTGILNTPEAHRAIRIICRGDYNKIAQAAEDEHNRLRKYLVATDLSDESTHALEWAIGTVLRDGDTLIAIYCVDEETGIVTSDIGRVPDDPKAMKEQAAAINSVTNAKGTGAAPTNPVTEFRRSSAFYFRGDSAASTPASSPAPTGRDGRSRAEEERRRAVQDITDRVLRLLRKTRLQVRVVVEVLHCKNPRHLITEVIDLVNPTLVVIGSRGRSALKGVILGSFSNYLVTKSSVPVMVARKRLRKQSKYKRADVRQVNNLSNPAARSLANAKID